MLRLFKHYLKFSRYTLISKFNYKNPHHLISFSKIDLSVNTFPFITNYIIASSLILLTSKQHPKFVKDFKIKKAFSIVRFKTTLRKYFFFFFLDNFVNLSLVKNRGFLKIKNLKFSNKIQIDIVNLYFFPEFYILFTGLVNSIFNNFFKTTCILYLKKPKNILEKNTLLKTVQIFIKS